MVDLETLFEKHDDQFLKSELIKNKLNLRPDLHAFLLLDKLIPGDRSMVSDSEHDKIWLDINLENLAEVITEEQVIELIRCGVMLEDNHLTLFV